MIDVVIIMTVAVVAMDYLVLQITLLLQDIVVMNLQEFHLL
jgi:hypothetical protein